jgi:DNA-binding response OmpR family regulator
MSHGTVHAGSLLLIDSDDSVSTPIESGLRYEGFGVEVAASPRLGLKAMAEQHFDLVVSGVMDTDFDGYVSRVRNPGIAVQIPILHIGTRTALATRQRHAKAETKHYLVMPFSMTELVTRVRALIGRQRSEEDNFILRYSDVLINEDTGQVWRAGVPIHLSSTEFNLLHVLLLNPRHVLTKQQIVGRAWHYDYRGNPDIVETYMCYLRKKLDALGPPLIHTIRHVGYVLRDG